MIDSKFEADVNILMTTKIRGKISQNFSLLIADSLLSEINWNGRKKMKAINKYKFFDSTLYGCLHQIYGSFEEYEKDLMEAMKKGKNRMDQRRHQLRLQSIKET